jgi:hypothetical protein
MSITDLRSSFRPVLPHFQADHSEWPGTPVLTMPTGLLCSKPHLDVFRNERPVYV